MTMYIIGEKINGFVPRTGKALEERDAEYIKEIAVKQSEAGSAYLDCCPAINEGAEELMHWMVDTIQSVSDTPICLDSPDPELLIKAMDWCDRPGLINSASLAAGKIDQIFPVIADTKWACVVMLDDDNGIPSSAEGRIEVFKKVMEKCKEYNIAPSRIFVDPLVETLGTNPESLLTFVEVCRAVKEIEPTVHITSGLSNISFGLPVRKMINIPFMVLAMNAGMDSAIVDPLNRDMMGVIYGTSALLGEDEFCGEYLEAYRDNLFGPVK